jgi:DNA-binding CsgD family transcriptional regulator/GTPase SAR1 family protein
MREGGRSLPTPSLEAEQRVQRFRVTASPMARRLAGLLAAAPVISLPIVRIIQDRLLPLSRQVHVAEVFLGGLLKPLVELEVGMNPDAVQYEFWDGVRDLLVESVATSDAVSVLDAVSSFVAGRLGLSVDAFMAVLRHPVQAEDQSLVSQSRPFARVTAQVLRKLGGEYAAFAAELEQGLTQKTEFSSVSSDNSFHNTERLYEAKLIIVGDGGVGKTTLAKKIQNPDYQLQEEHTTQGIDVTQVQFLLSDGNVFRVNIWDFGGQEIYHATYQFFFTERSLYALVIDTRREDTDFYYWLNAIQLLSSSSPLLIIKNEKQDCRQEISERQLRSEFTNLKGTLHTNLATQRGLSEILTQIQYHIQTLPHVGALLPKNWVKVRQALEQESRNYISLDEYLQICQTHSITRQEDKLQLSSYLHDLGVCLHFQTDVLLHRIIILKPTWGINAVYKVLDHPQIIRAQGKFTRADLASIWCEAQYATLRPELLRLMMSFQLCYEIPNRPGNYIAPQLLTPEQPTYSWDEYDNLLLRYEYEFMPQGIFTRFIVNINSRIKKQPYIWKNGVVLARDDARAEVIELYRYHKDHKGEIRIRVSGDRKREMLTTVCQEFGKIHASYARLRYNTLVPCQCNDCQGGQKSHFYQLQVLHRFLESGQEQIQCHKSFQMVNIKKMMNKTIGDTISRSNTQDALQMSISGNLVADEVSRIDQSDLVQKNRKTIATQTALFVSLLGLTIREAEVLSHAIQGKDHKQIAAQLFITTDTVRKHLQRICLKLEVNNRSEAIAQANSLLQEHLDVDDLGVTH